MHYESIYLAVWGFPVVMGCTPNHPVVMTHMGPAGEHSRWSAVEVLRRDRWSWGELWEIP